MGLQSAASTNKCKLSKSHTRDGLDHPTTRDSADVTRNMEVDDLPAGRGAAHHRDDRQSLGDLQ